MDYPTSKELGVGTNEALFGLLHVKRDEENNIIEDGVNYKICRYYLHILIFYIVIRNYINRYISTIYYRSNVISEYYNKYINMENSYEIHIKFNWSTCNTRTSF